MLASLFSLARLLNRCQERIALRDVMDECLITLREHPRGNLWGSSRLRQRYTLEIVSLAGVHAIRQLRTDRFVAETASLLLFKS